MLVLTRTEGERVFIGEGQNRITITVLEFRSGQKVRLGIEARPEIPVHRAEVAERIELEGRRQ